MSIQYHNVDSLARAVSKAIAESNEDTNIGISIYSSIAERPTAAEFGVGTCQIGGVVYVSDGIYRRNASPLVKNKQSVGTRIIAGRMGTFDNTTIKTFRAVIEIAAEGFDAVRPIFANGSTSATYIVASCNVRAIGATTDNIGSIGATTVTLPSSGVVPVAATATGKSFLLGDWVDISSIPRTDGGSGALVVFDAYITTAGSISIAGNGSSDVYTGWATRANRKWIMRHNNGDCVSNSALFTDTTNRSQSPIIGVQYIARGKVITVAVVGDSIFSGWGTIKGEGFHVPAAEYSQNITGIPFEVANVAWSTATPAQYKTQVDELVTAGIIPDLCILPSGSPNIVSTTITDLQVSVCKQVMSYLKRKCNESGIVPIVANWIPANPATKAYNSTDSKRTVFNSEVLSYAGEEVTTVDIATSVSGITDENGQVNFLAGTTADGVHPNDTGNLLIVDSIKHYIASAA